MVELGPVHDLEVAAVGHGETNVGHSHLKEAVVGPPRRLERLAEQPVPVGRHGGQQPRLVAEVVGRGGVADPGPARHLAQAHGRGPGVFDGREGRRDQCGPEVPVVVRARRDGHARHPT